MSEHDDLRITSHYSASGIRIQYATINEDKEILMAAKKNLIRVRQLHAQEQRMHRSVANSAALKNRQEAQLAHAISYVETCGKALALTKAHVKEFLLLNPTGRVKPGREATTKESDKILRDLGISD